jgi:hypothetical protein
MLGLQTLVWSGETITGVALFSRTFPLWQTADQVVGIAALIGIGWLTYRVGD